MNSKQWVHVTIELFTFFYCSLSSLFTIHSLVNIRDLRNPLLPLAMIHTHNLVMGPVEVIGDVGYLLIQAICGVAGYPPRLAASTSNSPSQWGQLTSSRLWPFMLMR